MGFPTHKEFHTGWGAYRLSTTKNRVYLETARFVRLSRESVKDLGWKYHEYKHLGVAIPWWFNKLRVSRPLRDVKSVSTPEEEERGFNVSWALFNFSKGC